MNIKVKPEGREDIYIAEKEDIIKYIKTLEQEYIHNMSGAGNMMLGADWNKEQVIEVIENSERIGILLGRAKSNNMGHSLAVVVDNRLEMFDIKIDKENLINN